MRILSCAGCYSSVSLSAPSSYPAGHLQLIKHTRSSVLILSAPLSASHGGKRGVGGGAPSSTAGQEHLTLKCDTAAELFASRLFERMVE